MQAFEGLIQIGGHQDSVIGGDPKECQEAYPDGDTEMGGPYLKERAQVLSPDFHVEKPGLLIKPEHDETTGPGNENTHEYHECGWSGPKLQEENEEDDPKAKGDDHHESFLGSYLMLVVTGKAIAHSWRQGQKTCLDLIFQKGCSGLDRLSLGKAWLSIEHDVAHQKGVLALDVLRAASIVHAGQL